MTKYRSTTSFKAKMRSCGPVSYLNSRSEESVGIENGFATLVEDHTHFHSHFTRGGLFCFFSLSFTIVPFRSHRSVWAPGDDHHRAAQPEECAPDRVPQLSATIGRQQVRAFQPPRFGAGMFFFKGTPDFL